MKRFITLKAGQLLLHLFHFLFFSSYFRSIHLSALLLIFNFLFSSSTFGRQHTFFFLMYTSLVYSLFETPFLIYCFSALFVSLRVFLVFCLCSPSFSVPCFSLLTPFILITFVKHNTAIIN